MSETRSPRAMAQVYKVCLLGEGGVGKTAFLHKLLTGKFEQRYVPTCGVDVQTLIGSRTFNVWDCAGQENFRGLSDAYYMGAHGALLMCDATSLQTFETLGKWIIEFRRVQRTAPIVVCVGKMDCVTSLTRDQQQILRTLPEEVGVVVFSTKTMALNSLLALLEASFTSNFRVVNPFRPHARRRRMLAVAIPLSSI